MNTELSSSLPSNTKANSKTASKSALKLALIYALISAIYIAISDRLVILIFKDIVQIELVNTIKGWCFVAITAFMLYLLVRNQIINVLNSSQKQQQIAEEKLKAIMLLDSISANSTDAIFAKDIHGKYLLCNRETEKAVGFTQSQVIGKDDTFIFPEAEAKQIIANDKKVMDDNKTITYKEYLTTPNGSKIYLATKGPLHDVDGKVIGMFGISRDITEWMNAEEKLHKTGELLSDISNLAKIGGWEFDTATREGDWTEEVSKIHETDVVDSVSFERSLSVFHGPWREKIDTAMQQAINLGLPYDLELEMVTPDGTTKWVRKVGMPIIVEGQVVKLRGFIQDISALKEKEQKLLLWEQAFNYAEFGLAIVDAADNTYLAVNPAFEMQHGYEAGELLGMSVFDCHLEENKVALKQHIKDIDLSGHLTFEIEHVR